MTIEEYQIKEQCILNDTIKAIQKALVDRWNKTYIENIDILLLSWRIVL